MKKKRQRRLLRNLLGLIVIASPSFGQITVNGNCAFSPLVRGIRVQIFLVDGKDTIDVQDADNSGYYRFKFINVPRGKPLFVRGRVDENDVYIQYERYGSNRWITNPHTVHFARKQDIYATLLGRANDAFIEKDIGKARNALGYITAHQDALDLTNDQKYEVYLGLGSTASWQNNHALQITFLDSAKEKVDFEKLSKAQIDRYTRDKFNAVLLKSSYNTLKNPLIDFSREVAIDSAKSKEWYNFIIDIGKYYGISNTSRDEEEIKGQVMKLNQLFNK